MSEEVEVKAPAKKRTYNRRPPAVVDVPVVPAVPEAPIPAVLALQDEILGIVKMRKDILNSMSIANSNLAKSQAEAQYFREQLKQVEGEVQYRMGLIAQLQGKPAMQGWVSSTAATPTFHAPLETYQQTAYGTVGIGSIPPSRPPMQQQAPGDNIRRESAEYERNAV